MELEEALKYIQNASKQFSIWDTKVETGDKYYDNQDKILDTGAALLDAVNGYLKNIGENPLRSADNRISCNWHEILTVQKAAYSCTYAPVITVADNEDLSNMVTEALGDDFQTVLSRLCTYATNAGTAWLQYWESDGKLKMTEHKANQCAAFTDPMDITKKKIALVRKYVLEDEKGDEKTHYEVWDDREVIFVNGETNRLETIKMGDREVERMPNPFGRIPFIEFRNNERRSSDLNKYKALIDAYDKIVSGFANDLDDIQEIILILKGFTGETESSIWVPEKDEHGNVMYDEDGEPILKEIRKPFNIMQQAKTQKFFTVDEAGGVDKITLDIPVEARNAALDLLQEQIYIAGMGVNPNPERTGQATGAYVDHMYHLLELKVGLMETEFRAAINELVRAILAYYGKSEDVKIIQAWTRNKPKDANEIVNRLNATPETVMSNYTKRRLHPDIEDPDAEDKLIEKEKKENLRNMMDSFGQPGEEQNGV